MHYSTKCALKVIASLVLLHLNTLSTFPWLYFTHLAYFSLVRSRKAHKQANGFTSQGCSEDGNFHKQNLAPIYALLLLLSSSNMFLCILWCKGILFIKGETFDGSHPWILTLMDTDFEVHDHLWLSNSHIIKGWEMDILTSCYTLAKSLHVCTLSMGVTQNSVCDHGDA